jgi:hypothetical protein
MGSGKRLRYSINKYGKENHKVEILEFFENREDLKKREREIVNLNEIAKKECMNLIVGGEGGRGFTLKEVRKGAKVTNEKHIKKLKNWRSKGGKNNYTKNGLNSSFAESRYDWFNKKHNKKTRIKMSNSKKGTGIGKENSQFGTCWIAKEGISKKIKKEELIVFVQQGWNKGRK